VRHRCGDDDTRTSILDTRYWILDAATGSANSASDQRQQAASTTSHQRPYPSTWASRTHRGAPSAPASRATSGAHRGVPSLVFFSLIALTRRFDSRKTPRGATPAVNRSSASLHATRQAAGVPSAGSQPPHSPFARPRRWCDAQEPQILRRLRRPGLPKTRSINLRSDVKILTTFKLGIQRQAPHSKCGLVAGHECPAYSSEQSRSVICR
jgi:hypothetical protein